MNSSYKLESRKENEQNIKNKTFKNKSNVWVSNSYQNAQELWLYNKSIAFLKLVLNS